MARPREFDEEQVLGRALEVFHAMGFDGTTLNEPEQATGLGRGSLHGAFGDKPALFLKALVRYPTRRCASAWMRGASRSA